MGTKLEQKLNEIYRIYLDLREAEEYYGAALRLALIFGCLPNIDSQLRQEWDDRIKKESLPDEIIQKVSLGLLSDAGRLRKILSIGDKWNEDEILQILLIREGIDLLLSFLKSKCPMEMDLDLVDIDQMIERLTKSEKNRRSFGRVVRLMQKNLELPIDREWLDHLLKGLG